jgi:cytochrome c oxidase assembly protein subunit 15
MPNSNAIPAAEPAFRRRAIGVWLVVVAALVVATLLVGGATRLTESGLSITEWKPVTGIVPPLTDAQWQAEFDKYKAIPQYRELNRGMSLSEFKTIFWWEWGHRLLGRTIGAVFLLPFLYFLWRGWVGRGLRWKLWTLFALGGLQGAVGWWMVYSGLSDRVSVSQYRLAFHMTLACVIYAAIVWTLRGLNAGPVVQAPARIRIGAAALALLVLLQIYLGALVAGLDAGLTYNTWPLIDGALVPAADRLWFLTPLWRNFFENELTVQFVHRMVAYVLWLTAILHAVDVVRTLRQGPTVTLAVWLAIAMTLQAAIGVATLLYQVPISLALLHQGTAIVILTIAVVNAERLLRRTRAESLGAGAVLAS